MLKEISWILLQTYEKSHTSVPVVKCNFYRESRKTARSCARNTVMDGRQEVIWEAHLISWRCEHYSSYPCDLSPPLWDVLVLFSTMTVLFQCVTLSKRIWHGVEHRFSTCTRQDLLFTGCVFLNPYLDHWSKGIGIFYLMASLLQEVFKWTGYRLLVQNGA